MIHDDLAKSLWWMVSRLVGVLCDVSGVGCNVWRQQAEIKAGGPDGGGLRPYILRENQIQIQTDGSNDRRDLKS
jgi:hypothetical protein